MIQMNLFTKQKQTHRFREQIYGCQEKGERNGQLGALELTYRHAIFKMDNLTNKVLLYSTGNSAQCYVAIWMGGKFGGEWIHVHVWLSPFAVHSKWSQHH